jgi:phenylacetate-CoA ligase
MFVPEEESLDRAGILRLQRSKLGEVLARARRGDTFYARRFESVAFDAQHDPIRALPLTTRADLQADQAARPPYGTLLTQPIERYVRLHQTSGSSGSPLRVLDTADDWRWWMRCWGILYRAAGVGDGDRFFFPFSFGPFVGFWAAFEGAVSLGHMALAGGGMTTVARLRHMIEHGVTIVGCTPTYALHLAEVAAAEGFDLAGSSVRALIVAGEPGGNIPATRRRIEQAFGARVFDHAGMTEVGPWGFECVECPSALHVMESEFIAEVIDPATLDPVEPGTPGELVLTNLGRLGMPLIRYCTGDRVTRMPDGRCGCGRWFARLRGGVEGRIDDMLVIRGNNVFPSAIEGAVRSFREVAEFRIRCERRGSLSELHIDVEPAAGVDPDGLLGRIEAELRNRFHFKPVVRLVASGSLPRYEMKAKRVLFGDDGTRD